MPSAKDPNGYELLRRLAAGGMGEVFVARRQGTADFEKDVALKLLLPHLTASPDSVKRFYDEARLAARMRHPNIVEIFDVGEASGRPFLAMQLVEGVSLSQHLRRLSSAGAQMPLPVVRFIAVGLCEALAYAHGLTDGAGKPLNLVHGDVTPSNLLLSTSGAVQLTDFGIARVGEGGARPGVLQGKAAYLAPEQLTPGASVDARADLYSAALTLYEVLTGTNPFRRDTAEESFSAIAQLEVPGVRALRPDVSPQLEAALRKALSRDPSERFQDASELRRALIDGPIAGGPELAEHVRLINGDRFAALRKDEPGDDESGTRSQVLSAVAAPPVTATRPSTRPRWPQLLAGLVVVGLAAGLLLTPGAGPKPAEGSRGEPSPALPARPLQPASEDVPRGVDHTQPSLPASSDPEQATKTPSLFAVTPTSPDGASRDSVEDPGGGTGNDAPRASAPTLPALPGSNGVPGSQEPAGAPSPVPLLSGRSTDSPTGASLAPTARPASKRPALKNPKLRVGYLAADAVPWAEVSVDGAVIDRTPFSKFPVPVGKHTITFRAPDGSTQARPVTISEGATTSLRVEFTARR